MGDGLWRGWSVRTSSAAFGRVEVKLPAIEDQIGFLFQAFNEEIFFARW